MNETLLQIVLTLVLAYLIYHFFIKPREPFGGSDWKAPYLGPMLWNGWPY